MKQVNHLHIKKVLIANRSEIALRIMATAHVQGIQTVAIYAEQDQFLSYVYKASESYKLPGTGASAYLDQIEILEIARKSGANAIHPGYGFLAENAEFAQAVIDAGFVWIGPTPRNIAILADKVEARKIMNEAGVPTIPGFELDASDPKSFLLVQKRALAFGYPFILKCAHGGGGKAMRLVKNKQDFVAAWNLVVSEAKRFFNSSLILLEKQIENPRHIEIQIAGDGDNFIHLHERECSIQRRHQKIIEEAPCSFISQKTKQILYDAAVRAARSVRYQNIGTVEFLVAPDESIYFLEINTRLQVEHSVTEMTTGIDLVALQFQLAGGKKLFLTQDEIVQRGHAIECRLYAENPEQNFAPSTGTISQLTLPAGPFLRIDHDLEATMEVSPFFDPMLAKFSTYGETREIAYGRMKDALENTQLYGIKTNVSFLQNILRSTLFKTGEFHTQLLDNKDNLTAILANSKNQENLLSVDTAKEVLKILQAKVNNLQTKPTSQTKTASPSRWRAQQWR